MKTSWNNDIREGEQYLLGKLTNAERARFESRLQAEPARYFDFFHLQRLWSVLRLYHRQILRREMNHLRSQINTSKRYGVLRRQLDQIFQS